MIKELLRILKEMSEFFVLKLMEIVVQATDVVKILNYNIIIFFHARNQFFVSGSGFFVLLPDPDNFNSLYSAPDSLKIKK